MREDWALARTHMVQRYEEGRWLETVLPLIEEYRLAVSLNGRPLCDAVCTPDHLEEMLAGRMLTAGKIQCVEEICSIRIDLEEHAGDIRLHKGVYEGDGVDVPLTPLPVPAKPMPLEIEQILGWMEALYGQRQESAPLYSATFSSHSCSLMKGGKMICLMEDIGRHNALDKAVGWAMSAHVDLRQCILSSSGRLPTDMIEKAIRAKVGAVVSKSLPTALAVGLAREHHLPLLHISARSGILRLA